MSETRRHGSREVALKIARLVEERGWNQEDFARITQLNRHTVRQILQPHDNRRLRNATIAACAEALGLSVNDLHTLPLERLLPRMHSQRPSNGEDPLRHMLEMAKQPELLAWIERNHDRARQLNAGEFEELLGLQGVGGVLVTVGVEHYVGLIERKRKLLDKVRAIAATEYVDLLEQMVELMYDKVHPYSESR
jgi:transcriptional regulator with XRE-family HTH domain